MVRKLVSLVVCFFMFQSSAQALYFYNQTDDVLHYIVGFRKEGTSKTFRELNVERTAPGGVQKLKFKDSDKARNFLKKAEENRETLPEEGGALEVVIRIERLSDSESASSVIYDGTLCTLKSLDHLIRLHDFAHADFCKDENNTYTLKLTDLRDTSSLVVEGEKIADETRG
ncbi:hypothetical protein QPK87_23625 [Kamptonema cortianum]|nr:hypothetical protein [Geitlerinema splendidum]MDK3159541.1 hypothetical protein [Kamptonema cortianum]